MRLGGAHAGQRRVRILRAGHARRDRVGLVLSGATGGQERIPRHRRQRYGPGRQRDRRVEQGRLGDRGQMPTVLVVEIRVVVARTVVVEVVAVLVVAVGGRVGKVLGVLERLARDGRRRLVMEVGHEHRCRLEVDEAVAADLDLLQRGRVDGGDGGLGRRPSRGRDGRRPARRRPPFDVGRQRDAAILGVHGAIMSQQQVAPDEGAATLEALERSLLGICVIVVASRQPRPAQRSLPRPDGGSRFELLTRSLVPTSMLAPAERGVAELTLVLLLRRQRRPARRRRRRRSRPSHGGHGSRARGHSSCCNAQRSQRAVSRA